MKKLPKLPKGMKVKTKYVSNEYLNIVCYDKKSVTFFLWDGVSENYNHVIVFPTFK